MAKIKIKRGLQVNLPTLETGELALTTDTQKVYIGTSSGNKEIGGGGGVVINEWQELTLLNSFTGYIKVRKNALGQVECITNLVTPTPFVAQAMAVIPEEFRPSVVETLFARRSEGGNLNIWLGSNGNFHGYASSGAGVAIQGSFVWLQE